jgi:GT2 family glycosyltransferase
VTLPDKARTITRNRVDRVTIAIVSYNTRELLRGCLQSIKEQTTVPHEVIVVDNASVDGSSEMVRTEFPDVLLHALDDNIGFGRGCNLALRNANSDYVLLLNPDTVVLDNAVDRLVEFAGRHPQCGVYGGRTLRPDGSVDPRSCWGLPTVASLICFATGLSVLFRGNRLLDPESLGRWPRDSVREVGMVTGCLALVSTPLWERLDGFDEQFWLFGEDADLSLRARSLGARPTIVPDAEIIHVVGASSPDLGRKKALVLRGKVTYFRKHWPRTHGLAQSLLLMGVAIRAATEVARRRDGGAGWRFVLRSRREWLAGWPPLRSAEN